MGSLCALAVQTCDWQGYADAEELRMVRVIAEFAADAALVHGVYGAAFRRFHIRAVRVVMTSGLRVKLMVTDRPGGCTAAVPSACAVILRGEEFEA